MCLQLTNFSRWFPVYILDTLNLPPAHFRHSSNNSWKFSTTSNVWYSSFVVTFQCLIQLLCGYFSNDCQDFVHKHPAKCNILLGAVMEKKLAISYQRAHLNQVIYLAHTRSWYSDDIPRHRCRHNAWEESWKRTNNYSISRYRCASRGTLLLPATV